MKKHLISIEKTNEVKDILNSCQWSGEYCHPHSLNEKDEEIALNILMNKSFGTYMIKRTIINSNIEDFKDFLSSIDVEYHIEDYNSTEAKYIALFYAHELAMIKLVNYLWKYGDRPGSKLYLPESYIFKIII